MPWILALLVLGAGAAYVYHGSVQPTPVRSGSLVPMHWYRVLWQVSGPAALGPAVAQAAVQATMLAQGFTGALAVLAQPVPQSDGSLLVTGTGPYVLGAGTLVGVPSSLTLGTIVEVNPPAGNA